MKKFRSFILFVLVLSSTIAYSQTVEPPSGKLSGVFFMDYYYNAARDTGYQSLPNRAISGNEGVHGLQIRRIFLTYDYKLNSKFSSRFRLESDEANFTSNLGGDKAMKFGVSVKDAFVKWNFYKKHDLYIGLQHTSAFEVSEMIWENRYIEKTIMDIRGIVSTREMGISLRGSLDSTGKFKYWLMYGNGNSNLPESDKYKRFYAQTELNLAKNLYISLFADFQARSEFENPLQPTEKLANNIITTAFFAGYKVKDKFSLGAEMFLKITQNGYRPADNYINSNTLGLSLFGTYYFSPKTNIYGRYDIFNPNTDSNVTGDSRNLIIAGFAYKPNEKLIISPNILMETYEDMGRTVSNSITTRITFSWAF